MLKRIKQRFKDMKTLSVLMQAAERQAIRRNEGKKPGAEHFVLAAIELPDGAAKTVFHNLGLNATSFEHALREQYKASLTAMGIEVDDTALPLSEESEEAPLKGVPTVVESGSVLLQRMAKSKIRAPLSGATVLRTLDQVPVGPAHRALLLMGTTPEAVAIAANDYIERNQLALG